MRSMQAHRRGVFARIVALVVTACLLAPVGFAADDVPDAARKEFDKAQGYVEKGDAKSLARAWKMLGGLRDTASGSCDFWELYVDVGRALEKDEAQIWKAIETREQQQPDSPTFDLLRARFATTLADRKTHVQNALTKSPGDLLLKVMLAGILVQEEEEFDAEELLDVVLAENPDLESALVLKGRIQLLGGYNNAAIEFADENLVKHPIAGLHNLKAEAFLAIHEAEGKDTLDEALKCSEAAVAVAPEPAYVVTMARILESKGDPTTARSTVEKHFSKTPSPLLAALLGEYAFAAGDYPAAIRGFARGAAKDPRAAKGLTACHARLGMAKEALAALETVKRLVPTDVIFQAEVLEEIGEPEQAYEVVKDSEDELAPYARAWLSGTLGRPAAIQDLLAEAAGGADARAEFFAICWLRASVFEKMGLNAAAGARTKLRKADHAAAAKGATPPSPMTEPIKLAANTTYYMTRVPFYVCSACGTAFQPDGAVEMSMSMEFGGANKISQSWVVKATSDCARDSQRIFQFNEKSVGDGGELEFELGDNDGLETAFKQGLAALGSGDAGAARSAFATAAQIEPNWHRLGVFGALAGALAGEDRTGAARAALAASADWPDDVDARELALLLGLWAGIEVAKEIQATAERREAISERRLSEL